MAAKKKCLYIALYPSGVVGNEESRYHWAFLIGPKAEKGVDVPSVRYHVKNNPISGWTYEEKSVSDVRSTNTLLVRIVIAKVENEQRLINPLRNLPVNSDSNWRCRSWVGQALVEIAKDGECVKAEDMLKPKPTYDLLEGKETVP
ncbi:hypothetical protein K469DRAFT_728319 [Zopfia rhizophila CBS 207.26]|uniref:Uncharacterized protein n=1 Tax=Zopfia rhizophila CBS 207.26 TaxID=1314779 RepID=A0A6A6DTT5_9PEZI|nr:hypothetical protein K469DRAFT_728319 [Zopfia rhizophila CBS 207.26]